MNKERGATGLVEFHGVIQEESIPKLRSLRQRVRVFADMANDPVIGAILFAIETHARQIAWDVRPADDSPEAKKHVEFLKDCMEDMSHSWQDFLSEVLSMLPFGFSLHEIVYKPRDDGRIGWAKIPIRAQETIDRWDMDKNKNLKGVYQIVDDILEVRIPADKFLLFRTTSFKNNPEGKSILRSAYRAWYFKKKLEIIEAIGVERELAGYPVLNVPNSVFEETDQGRKRLQRALDIVTNIRKDEQMGAVLPDDWVLTLLSSSGSQKSDTDGIIQRYDMRIAQSVLSDVLLMGHASVGSYALAETKMANLTQTLNTWVNTITDVFNKDAIPRLFALNGITEKLPILYHGPVVSIDPLRLANILFRLVGVDIVRPDDDMEPHMRNLLGLPQMNPETTRRKEENGDSNLDRQRSGRMDNETRPTSLDGNYTQTEM